jgi:hypothetical protein
VKVQKGVVPGAAGRETSSLDEMGGDTKRRWTLWENMRAG